MIHATGLKLKPHTLGFQRVGGIYIYIYIDMFTRIIYVERSTRFGVFTSCFGHGKLWRVSQSMSCIKTCDIV